MRRLAWASGLVVLSLVTAGCTGDSSGPEGEIAIGVSLDRSGPSGALGVGEGNALALVADDINKQGLLGKKLKLVIKDNKSDAKESARVVKDMVENDNVVGIIGGSTTTTTMSYIDYVTQKKIPAISMGASDTIVNPVAKRQYIFKTPAGGAAVVGAMVQEFTARGIKKLGLLAPNSEYGNFGIAALSAASRQADIQLVATERFEESAKDYKPQVGRIIDAEPDAIVIAAIMPGAGIAAKNIKELGFKGRVYNDGGAGAELFVAGAGAASEGMSMIHPSILAANQITATTPSALAQKEFFTKYTQRHGTYSGYASYGADALNLMVAAIKKANDTDGQKIRDALESLSYDGLGGSYQFGPGNHGGASGDGLTVLTVQRGAWVLSQ